MNMDNVVHQLCFILRNNAICDVRSTVHNIQISPRARQLLQATLRHIGELLTIVGLDLKRKSKFSRRK